MSQSPIAAAVKQICQEKNISEESVIESIEAALAAAYRKEFAQKNQNIKVEFDLVGGQSRVFDVKEVVDDELFKKFEEEQLAREKENQGGEIEKKPFRVENVDVEPAFSAKSADSAGEEEELKFNPRLHITLSDAKEIKANAKIGDEIRVELSVPDSYGRVAAQTAKQVIIQRLREAERNQIFEDFKDHEGKVMTGTIQRRDGNLVLVDLNRATGFIPPDEQVYHDRYNTGNRMKVYIKSVAMGTKGPEIILSRTSPEIVRELFFLEIPEVANGLVSIKAIAREAGWRSKIAVSTDEENIDPIGSCVGQRGTRVQTIIGELNGEKIDIINWSAEPATFVASALSPAKILTVEIDETNKEAKVNVDADQLSLAIGREGQNVRLASKLTGYKINIVEVKDGAKRELTEEEINADLTQKDADKDADNADKTLTDAEPAAVEALAGEAGEEVKAEPEKKKRGRKKKGADNADKTLTDAEKEVGGE